MKNKLLLFLTILLIPFMVNAKSIKMEWQELWGDSEDDYFFSIIELKDGTIVTGGYHNSIEENGKFDTFKNAVLIKYDEDGNKIWKKIIEGENDDGIDSLAPTNDGGFLAAMSTYSTDLEGCEDIVGLATVIFKYDSNGNVEWKKVWDGNDLDFINGINVFKDDSFVVIGESDSTDLEGSSSTGYSNAIIMKYDKNGNYLWGDNYGGSKNDNFSIASLTDEGDIIVVGTSESTDINGITNIGSSDGIIVKYDKDGNILWQKNWGGTRADKFRYISKLKDGNYIILGNSYSLELTNNELSSRYYFMLKIDKDGNVIWQKNTYAYLGATYPTNDDGYVVIGDIEEDDIEDIEVLGDSDFLLMKYDGNGNREAYLTFGGTDYDSADYIYMTKKGYILAAGQTESTDIDGLNATGGIEGYIAKFSLQYTIEKLPTSNGTIESKQEGNKVIITPTPEEKYAVDKVVVKNTNGEEIPTEKQNDGTYTFEINSDVTIEVTFKEKNIIDNPDTSDKTIFVYIYTLIIIYISCISYIFVKNKIS